MDGMENIAELAKSVMNADRRALSQAITLIESSRMIIGSKLWN